MRKLIVILVIVVGAILIRARLRRREQKRLAREKHRRECPNCSASIGRGRKVCPECGYKLTRTYRLYLNPNWPPKVVERLHNLLPELREWDPQSASGAARESIELDSYETSEKVREELAELGVMARVEEEMR